MPPAPVAAEAETIASSGELPPWRSGGSAVSSPFLIVNRNFLPLWREVMLLLLFRGFFVMRLMIR